MSFCKQTETDLALFGGQPLFAEALHVGRPQTPQPKALLASLGQVLESGWLSNQGPQVQAFEQAICAYLDVPHCILTANGTLALMLMFRALGISGEVIVPSFTFPATVHALEWQGLQPVFCDIDPESHTLSATAVAQLISPRTSAILGVHVWGRACEIDALQQLADQNSLVLMFDAAHAFGCSYKDRLLGGFGAAEMLSFHATKFLHSLEGGAIVTRSEPLAQELRRLRNFGYQDGQVTGPGINAKLNEMSAAVGLHNLSAISELIEANTLRYTLYRQLLARIPGLKLCDLSAQSRQNFQYVVIEVLPEYGLSRDQLLELLTAENILTRRYFDPPCHQLPTYHKAFSAAGRQLPVTDRVASRVLVLPTGLQLASDQIETICALLDFLQQQAPSLQRSASAPETSSPGFPGPVD